MGIERLSGLVSSAMSAALLCAASAASAQAPREQTPVRPQGLMVAPRGSTPTASAGAPPLPPPALPPPARPEGTRQVATPSQQRGHGRLFQPQDLGMLEGPDREAWQKPDQVMDALGIGDGSVVADLGAGGGWFTVRLAKRVGPNGVVYAEDIQPQMIEAIQRRVDREGLHNVSAVLGEADHPALPVGRLDAALMVDTFHEVEDTRSLLTNVRAALKPGGRLGIIEYRTEGGGPGPSREERIQPGQVIRAAEAAGFRLMRQEQFLQFQYLLIFTR
ncbi:class I SAM-dependent methyltransferase [Luteitalea sp. TBR-22]|uniref:class I SAM-dependent methyltransferase n=1 Tax=Luteitalea sp. TBR-22 TaxID=2802971 RepID=UPI001EF5FBFD|nr:class I SAM-dependent methyltransferase [Luteitalea sp. TBR-22]